MADTNFVHTLQQKWAQHDAMDVLEFVEKSVTTNPCLETISAKGIIYGTVLGWGVAATNLFEEARTNALSSEKIYYNDDEMLAIERCIGLLKTNFIAIAEMGNGELGNVPVTNAFHNGALFQAMPVKPIFFEFIEFFDGMGHPLEESPHTR